MLKPIIKPIIKPVQKLKQAFRRQSLLERRQKQMEILIQQRQIKGLPTKAEELHKENIQKEVSGLERDVAKQVSDLSKEKEK